MSTAELARAHVVERCATLGIAVYDTPNVKIGEVVKSAVVFRRQTLVTLTDGPEQIAATALFTILAAAPSAIHIPQDWISPLGNDLRQCTMHLFDPADGKWQRYWVPNPAFPLPLADTDALMDSWRRQREAFLLIKDQ